MKLFFASFLFLSFSFLSDETKKFSWKEEKSFSVSTVDAWDVDPMGKVIFSKNDVITKLDTTFKVQFTQSLKGTGSLSSIDARHALKTLVFSEDQQVIAFMDNTLTVQDGLKDLGEQEVAYATHVSYSSQSNRYWVYDADNSKLFLVDEMQQRPQIIENLAGSLGGLRVDQLMEIENKLLIFDHTKGVYLFDIYGSLIDFIEFTDGLSSYLTKNYLYYLSTSELVRISLQSRKEERIKLPEENILKFRVLGSYVYFQTANEIKKYLLKK